MARVLLDVGIAVADQTIFRDDFGQRHGLHSGPEQLDEKVMILKIVHVFGEGDVGVQDGVDTDEKAVEGDEIVDQRR